MKTGESTGGLFGLEPAGTRPLTAVRVREEAFAMPFHRPVLGRSPSWFLDRPSLTVTYRTDMDLARALVPEPLVVKDPLVSLSFLYMVAPGIGDYYEFAQSILCSLDGEEISYRPLMVAENVTAIIGGREIWGLPKIYGHPRVGANGSSYVGTLEYDGALVARASMAYKYQPLAIAQAEKALMRPSAVLKIVPGLDGKARSVELVRFEYSDIAVKGAWTGPGSLDLFHHEAAPIAALPVREIVSVTHTISDSLLMPGKAIYDYLK